MSQKSAIKIKPFIAIQASVEVNGATINSTLEGSAIKSLAQKLLVDEGLPAELISTQFYPQQKWLNILQKIQSKYGAATLKMIGKKIPETANFPPQINSIEAGLQSIGMAYQMNHRGGEIGTYKFQKTGDHEGIVECNNPFPCEFDLGIVEGMAKRFAPTAQVRHLDGECRKTGGNICRYKVNW